MVLDCVSVFNEIKEEVKEKIKSSRVTPKLAIIQVGDNDASNRYVAGKIKDCHEVGIEVNHYHLNDLMVTENQIIDLIGKLNLDDSVHGIMVQLPLPPHLDPKEIFENIDPYKDVDGLSPINLGQHLTFWDGFVPCTARGIIEFLNRNDIQVSRKTCVVVGRSEIVGKPIAREFLERNGTVIQCHSKTPNLKEFTRMADILVVAIGNPNVIEWDYVKYNAIVFDVGINRNEYGKLRGDVPPYLDEICQLTPVPKGVGLLTRGALLLNVVDAAITNS